MTTRERYSVPAIIACVAAMTVIGLIMVVASRWAATASLEYAATLVAGSV